MKKTEFDVGSTVRHCVYGDGVITSIGNNHKGEKYYAVFFPAYGTVVDVFDEARLSLEGEAEESPATHMEENKAPNKKEPKCEKLSEHKKSDPINNPSHYNTGKFKVIDFIEDAGLATGFNLGNAIKYLSRAGHKQGNTTLQDIEKAEWYIKRQIGYWNKEDGVELMPTGKIDVIDYIDDKSLSYNLGRAVELVHEALCADDMMSVSCLQEALTCVQREIKKLKAA